MRDKKMVKTLLCLAVVMGLPALAGHAQDLQTATVRGAVLDQDKNPFAAAKISFNHETRGSSSATTDKKGQFQKRLIEMGHYTIKPEIEGYIVLSMALNVKGPAGVKLLQQTLYVGEDQQLPTVDVKGDHQYDVVIAMVKAGFHQERREQVELGKYQESVLEAENSINAKKYDEAIDKLQKIIDKKKDEPYLFYLLGTACFANDQEDKAGEQFTQALALNPSYKNANFYLGRIAYDKNDFTKAAAYFEKEKAITPELPEVYLNLGVCYQKLEQYQKAADCFEKLKELTPDDVDVYDKLIFLYEKLGNKDKMEKVLNEKPADQPKDPSAYYNLGVQHWQAKNYIKAEMYFKKALEANPALADAHKALAYCMIHDKRNHEALTHLQEYLKLNPTAGDAKKITELIESLKK